MPGLPKKVREAGEAADAALQDLKDGKQPVVDSPAAEAGDKGTPAPVVDPPAEPAPPGTPEPAGKIDWKGEAEKAIHKFNVLNGKYTSEVPVLHEEIRVLKERLQALEAGGAPPADPDTPAATDGAASTFEVPDDIKELYGDDLPKWVKDVAAAAAANAVKPVAQKVDSFATEATRDRGEAFFAAISEAHSDWETINGLEVFKSFLKEIVPELGVERQAIIEKAQHDFNPKPIIAQIGIFKEKYGQGEQTRLQSQETPAPSGSAPLPVDSSDPEAIKESDIAKFYVDAAQGKYRRNPEEFTRLENMIRAASEAGKIIMDITPPQA
jgi:hypothetical protein